MEGEFQRDGKCPHSLGDTIDEYRAYHQRFYDKFGDMTWAIQYQADVRMRSERMLRLLRTAQASHEKALADAQGYPFEHDFDPARPWNHVFSAAAEDAKWWHSELEYNALVLVSTKANVSDFLGGDARISTSAPASTPAGVDQHSSTIHEAAGRGSGGWDQPAAKRQKLNIRNVDASGSYTTS